MARDEEKREWSSERRGAVRRNGVSEPRYQMPMMLLLSVRLYQHSTPRGDVDISSSLVTCAPDRPCSPATPIPANRRPEVVVAGGLEAHAATDLPEHVTPAQIELFSYLVAPQRSRACHGHHAGVREGVFRSDVDPKSSTGSCGRGLLHVRGFAANGVPDPPSRGVTAFRTAAARVSDGSGQAAQLGGQSFERRGTDSTSCGLAPAPAPPMADRGVSSRRSHHLPARRREVRSRYTPGALRSGSLRCSAPVRAAPDDARTSRPGCRACGETALPGLHCPRGRRQH